MPKIVIIGAGSAVFSKNLIADILAYPALKNAEIALVDIDAERLKTVELMARAINNSMETQCVVRATTDRREALPGADFVICTMGIGGIEAVRDDLEIPLRFGLRQTVGDTLGIGGIFRAARSIPEILRLCKDIEELCPAAFLFNYANPMAMHCLAIQRHTSVRATGLCHGVRNTARTMRMITAMMEITPSEIERHFSRPPDDPERIREWSDWTAKGEDPDLSYICAGINHMAFFLRFESGGRDLYPLLRQAMELPHIRRLDPVRFELYKWLGYFMTETSGHTAEYTPWFMKSEQEINNRHLDVVSYINTCKALERDYRLLRGLILAGEPVIKLPYKRSVEYAPEIINAIATDQPVTFNGNLHNNGGALISNLPGDCCVETPCIADSRGFTPTETINLPPQCAALIRTNVNIQDLAVRGIVEGRRDYIYQAAMLDPNTAATLTLPEIRNLVDAMFAAHAERLPPALRK